MESWGRDLLGDCSFNWWFIAEIIFTCLNFLFMKVLFYFFIFMHVIFYLQRGKTFPSPQLMSWRIRREDSSIGIYFHLNMSLPFLSLAIIFYTFKYFNLLKNYLVMCFAKVDASVFSGVGVGVISVFGLGVVGVCVVCVGVVHVTGVAAIGVSVGVGVGLVGVGVIVGIRFPPIIPL